MNECTKSGSHKSNGSPVILHTNCKLSIYWENRHKVSDNKNSEKLSASWFDTCPHSLLACRKLRHSESCLRRLSLDRRSRCRRCMVRFSQFLRRMCFVTSLSWLYDKHLTRGKSRREWNISWIRRESFIVIELAVNEKILSQSNESKTQIALQEKVAKNWENRNIQR